MSSITSRADAVGGRLPTRARLILAAVQVLSEHGMAGTTMTAVAQQAGVSRPTLYKHFPDVDHILAAMAREEFQSFGAQLDRDIDPQWPVGRQLEELVRAHLAYYGAETRRLGDGSMDAGASPVVRAAVEEELVAHHARVVGVLQTGVRRGELRSDLDVDLAAELVQHVLGGLRHTLRRHGGDPERFVTGTTAMLLDGLAGSHTP